MLDFGGEFRLTLLTNDPVLARQAEAWSVDRIGVDLERVGKSERQLGEGLRLSTHTSADLPRLGSVLRRAALFVRVNPVNAGSEAEIETVLSNGAQVLMLPYFRTTQEVEQFVRWVGGRAYVILLVETSSAAVRIRDILAVPGIDEVMVGLNDLRLELRVRNVFEVLVSPLLESVACAVRRTHLPFSVGGVARLDDASLPVPADLVLAQYPRLGATGAWLSRSFLESRATSSDAGEAIGSIRRRLTEWSEATAEARESARDALAARARNLG